MIGLLKYRSGVHFNHLQWLQWSPGVPLSASTQRDIVSAVVDVFPPVHEVLTRQAADGDVVHNDDARVKILERMGARARHSTPLLTLGRYSHVGLSDQGAAVDRLPDLTSQRPERMQATGTEDARPNDQPNVVRYVARNEPREAVSGRLGAQNDRCDEGPENAKKPEKTTVFPSFRADGEGFEPPVGSLLQQFSRLP